MYFGLNSKSFKPFTKHDFYPLFSKFLYSHSFFFSCDTGLSSSDQRTSTTNTLETFLFDKGYEKIHLKKLSTGRLLLKGQLNGIEGAFILDTGAGTTTIHQKKNLKCTFSHKKKFIKLQVREEQGCMSFFF